MPSCSGSWFFFCPLLSFAFSSFLRFLLEEVLCETTLFEAWSLGFITFVFWKALPWENRGYSLVFLCFPVLFFRPFLFPQLGRYFSPTGQVILRAFWITMQRYEIPIYQVCDSVRYHAIAEHFYSKHLTLSRFPEVIENRLHLLGRERLASLFIPHLLQFIPERLATPNPTHEMIHGRAWHTLGKVHQPQFLLRIRAVYKIFHLKSATYRV